MKITYDINLMKFMTLFENITRANLKDCFELGDKLVFVVQPAQIGKAIGKNASNIKRLEDKFKRKIRIIEFNPDVSKFVKNAIFPIRGEVNVEGEIVKIKSPDSKARGLLIGRSAQNLRTTEKIVQRFFKEIKEIKVE